MVGRGRRGQRRPFRPFRPTSGEHMNNNLKRPTADNRKITTQ